MRIRKIWATGRNPKKRSGSYGDDSRMGFDVKNGTALPHF